VYILFVVTSLFVGTSVLLIACTDLSLKGPVMWTLSSV